MIGFPGSAGSRPRLACGPFSIIIVTIIVVIVISTVISALFIIWLSVFFHMAIYRVEVIIQ